MIDVSGRLPPRCRTVGAVHRGRFLTTDVARRASERRRCMKLSGSIAPSRVSLSIANAADRK